MICCLPSQLTDNYLLCQVDLKTQLHKSQYHLVFQVFQGKLELRVLDVLCLCSASVMVEKVVSIRKLEVQNLTEQVATRPCKGTNLCRSKRGILSVWACHGVCWYNCKAFTWHGNFQNGGQFYTRVISRKVAS